MNIIGLGNCGCNIVRMLSELESNPYECYYINTEKSVDSDKFCLIPEQSSPEEYEESYEDCWIHLDRLFRDIHGLNKEQTWLVLTGGNISGLALRICQMLKGRRHTPNILYVKPEKDFNKNPLMERAAFYILQEYARSGALGEICLVSNDDVVELLGGQLSVSEYYSRINETIAHVFHAVNIFEHSQSMLNNFARPSNISRVSTIGTVDIYSKNEKLLFELDSAFEKCYYIPIDTRKADEDMQLLSDIHKFIKSQRKGNAKVTYGIFAVDNSAYQYSYCKARSSKIQER